MSQADLVQPEPSPPAGPGWTLINHDVLCPLCDYNLRGLSNPRCPECGYRFEWSEMLDPNRQPHPFLFEHHPERNWWSYWRTVAGACRPRAFWRSLHPVQTSRPRRLLLFWLIGGCLHVMVGAVFVLSEATVDFRLQSVTRAKQIADTNSCTSGSSESCRPQACRRAEVPQPLGAR
ncbi:MAG TPA: hypothetical protein VLM89_06245 [Phycisphaerae bacterium]|nr:hypothetical protein [Phycisphaerae bacterium]